MSPPERRLRPGEAALLGALHGPAELLPISSSAHVTLVPWLLGWDYVQLDDELRKAFEVALHAGTAAALAITMRDEIRHAFEGRSIALIGLSTAPAALVGYVGERPVEQRLGTPASIAAALLAGALVMAYADRRAERRGRGQATAGDAVWIGLAQATALVPGISRNGATLTAARLRGFTRAEASRLSRHAALPVIAAATVLKAGRIAHRALPAGVGVPFLAGAAASFASTFAFSSLARQADRGRPLWPYAVYRVALAALVITRLGPRHRPQ